MSELGKIAKAIASQAKKAKLERKKFNDHLGEPEVFLPDKEDKRFGLGLFKEKKIGGVSSYRRYANGYDPNSRIFYSKEFITTLYSILKE